MFEKLQYNVTDGIATIEMVHPKNLNAIDSKMADELVAALDLADKDEAVKVVLIKGGERAFSAGGDIDYFNECIHADGPVVLDPLIKKVDDLAFACKKHSKLLVAAVRGSAAGGGASLALACDFVFCTEDARFILSFIQLGLAPDAGITYVLTKQIGDKRTLELSVTGRPVGSTEAKELGLVHEVTTKEDLDEKALAFAKKLAAGPIVAYTQIKKQIMTASYSNYEQFLAEEMDVERICSNTEDFKEGVTAFLEKRKPVFKGK